MKTNIVALLGSALLFLWGCEKLAVESKLDFDQDQLFSKNSVEQTYYWSGGKKIPLDLDSSAIIIRSNLDSGGISALLEDNGIGRGFIKKISNDRYKITSQSNLLNTLLRKPDLQRSDLSIHPSFK